MRLLIATRSSGKLKEIRRILGDVDALEVLGLDDAGIAYDPVEDDLEPHMTFEENAVSKARYFHERSGLPTVADDSGIEIDALNGAPGVRSKRFALDDTSQTRGEKEVEEGSPEGSEEVGELEGPEGSEEVGELEGPALDAANNRHMVERLQGVAPGHRTARYVCVAVLLEDGRPPLTIRGEAPGVIVDEPSGAGGFGYDPHVFDPTLGKTFAEMTGDEKDARSHRGHAFRALAAELRSRMQGAAT